MFSCTRYNGYSFFKFNDKILLKKKFVTKEYEDSLLEALKMGYTIGSMDTNSPIFLATINKMKIEVDNTIDDLNKSLFYKDSDGR